MKGSNFEVELIVRGRPVREFNHQAKTYIEGRKGSNFEIRIHNNSFWKVLAVPSVDGISVMDGEEASSESSGYVLMPHTSMVIPGWRLDNEEVAQFFFQKKKGGYAKLSGKSGNEGVIGVMFYHEKNLFSSGITWNDANHWNGYNNTGRSIYGMPDSFNGMNIAGSVNIGANINLGDTVHDSNLLKSSGDPIQCNYAAEVPVAQGVMRGITQTTLTNTTSAEVQEVQEVQAEVKVDEKLAVGFGKATKHEVSEISFNRTSMPTETIVIYYDNRQGLEARGIQVVKPKPKKVAQPNPFPGSGCKPPKTWRK